MCFPVLLVPSGNAVSFSPIPVKWGKKTHRFGCLSSVLFRCALSSSPSSLTDISLQVNNTTDTPNQRYFRNQCILSSVFDCKSLSSALKLKGRRVYLFLKMILPSFFSLVLGVLVTPFIYPWYNNAKDEGKLLIALFAPLSGVIFKAISRICFQRLWNITHPGYSYVLLVPWYFGSAIIFRILQADLDSFKSITTIGIIHGSVEVIERSTIVFIDHISHMIWKRSTAPWGHFRTPRRERLMADIVIISMLYEAAAIVSVNGAWFLHQWVYIEGDFSLHLFVRFAFRTSIALMIEWLFSSVSLAIVTRYQNMAAMAVWRKRWKRHLLVALVNTVPLAPWTSKYISQIISERFDGPNQACKMPFTGE